MSQRDDSHPSPTRRAVLGAGIAGAATLAAVAAGPPRSHGQPSAAPDRPGNGNGGGGGGGGPSSSPDNRGPGASRARMPVVFLPHGGGPWPFVDLGFGDRASLGQLAAYLRSVAAVPPVRPKALLVVSAHWEERVPTVMTAPRPPMLYDYYGFPPESYAIQWPAPGQPTLAARVRDLLGGAGIDSAADPARGFDHGTFVPLKLTFPDADIPTIQLSLKAGLDPAEHLAIGRALAPLRDEGIFIVGSGMTFHNLRAFRDPRAPEVAARFDAWLRDAATRPAAARDRALTDWATAPAARQAHPREEHLLPLMVIAGAAGPDPATIAYQGTFASIPLSAYHFG
jgi:aromatic ring-opening dioxygenase catalytic subunit (LigB family)